MKVIKGLKLKEEFINQRSGAAQTRMSLGEVRESVARMGLGEVRESVAAHEEIFEGRERKLRKRENRVFKLFFYKS